MSDMEKRIEGLSLEKQKLLAAWFESGATGIPVEMAEKHAPPTSPLEINLAEIWSSILKIHPIGVHDNFFALGGDSILAIRIVALAEKKSIPLSVSLLFEKPTIGELAASIQGSSG